jgi:transcriptional regulator with XRE-family HTH domain
VPENPAQDNANERLGMNVRILRESMSMSQRQLATAMDSWGWHQQTVAQVENGNRSVRFGELESLAAILGVSLDRLGWGVAEATEAETVRAQAERARQAAAAVTDAVAALLDAFALAQELLSKPASADTPRVRAARIAAADVLDNASLDAAVQAGVKRHGSQSTQEYPDETHT